MKKLIQLSTQPNNHVRQHSTRYAVVNVFNRFDKYKIKEFEKTFVKEKVKNEDEFFATPIPKDCFNTVVNEIAILDEKYQPEATVLTGNDWKAINDAIDECKAILDKEEYTLGDYYL